jgi:hypothetical protein
MKKSLIWIAAGVAAVGFAVPAFAAHGDTPEHIVPTSVTVATAPTIATSNTVEDNPARISIDDNGVDASATVNSVTVNSVEDVSGPCDEAEHATDPRCTGATATSTDDNSGHDAGDDNSSHRGGSDDDSGHNRGGDDD